MVQLIKAGDSIEPKAITESMENYLGVILDLQEKNTVARAGDSADRLGVQRGSVTGLLKKLKSLGMINYRPYSFITLIPKGKRLARDVAHRHATLKDFLVNVLRIDPETAEQTACRMEHGIDKKTLERLVCFIEYIHVCPRAGDEWLDSFINYCASRELDQQKCDRCVHGLTTILE